MLKNLLFMLLFACMASGPIVAQTTRNCGTMEIHHYLLANDAEYAANRLAIEEFTQNFVANNEGGVRTVYTIPVVFHVVYNTTAENISDAQVLSQLDVLNEDLRRLNSDASSTPSYFAGIAADCEIQFCLATTDPSGNPTTGITEHQHQKLHFLLQVMM